MLSLVFLTQENPSLPILAIFFVCMLVVIFLIYGFRDVFKGQSIGKRALGIGVRDINDKFAVPSVSRLFFRQIFTFIWPVEFLVLALNGEHRKIGDQMMGTAVYDLREYENYILYTKRMQYYNQSQPQSWGYSQNAEQTHPFVAPVRPTTVKQYKPKKFRIAIIVVSVVMAIAILFGAFAFGIISIIRNHPSHYAAKDYIRSNSEIVAVIGEVESFGFLPSGSVSTSVGRGDANFAIRTIGTYGNARVFIELQMRDGGDWEVIHFAFVQIP